MFVPVSDTKQNTSENLTKTITEISINNNKALQKFNNKLLQIMKDRGLLATCLMSPLSRITKPENTSQFEIIKDSSSNRVNDLLIYDSTPITL